MPFNQPESFNNFPIQRKVIRYVVKNREKGAGGITACPLV